MQFTMSSPSSKKKDVIHLQVNCFTTYKEEVYLDNFIKASAG